MEDEKGLSSAIASRTAHVVHLTHNDLDAVGADAVHRMKFGNEGVFTIWSSVGLNSVIFLAGLQGISPSVLEAAQLDGAGPWSMLTRIRMPLISPMPAVAPCSVSVLVFPSTFKAEEKTSSPVPEWSRIMLFSIWIMRSLVSPVPV